MKTSTPDVYSSVCPSRQVLSRVGDKWTALVIGILERGTVRFGVLRREITGISQKMLTQTLRNLERDGLVERRIFAEVPVRVEYSLTGLGKNLVPVLTALMRWSESHLAEIEAAQRQFDKTRNGVEDEYGTSL
jgi:DNA-binding HxlR family transcriptional regulator